MRSITIDERGTLLLVNHAFEKLFGYGSSEAIGRNVSMLMPEPDRSAHDGYLHRYLQTGRTAIIGTGRQVLGQRKNGTLFPIDLAVSEIKIGGRILFAGIMRDMTERKQSEANCFHTTKTDPERAASRNRPNGNWSSPRKSQCVATFSACWTC